MWKIRQFLAFVHTFCLLLATLIVLGDELRCLEGKGILMKAFHMFTITLETVRSVYKDFFLSIFHQKSSKIAMFSYISEMYENIAILLDF